MRGAACRGSSALATLPRTAVVRVTGASVQQLTLSLDPLPPDAPVVIRCSVPVSSSASAVVADLLDRLETAAIQLFPAWLPDGDTLSTASNLDRTVVRMFARRHAANSEHFGPFLADVAEAALLGRARFERFPPEIRARGLARILADAYHRDGLVLLIDGSAEVDDDRQDVVAVAFAWLADHGIGVWLTHGVLRSVDRFPTTVVGVTSYLEVPTPTAQPDVTFIAIPAPLGKPHPLSQAEQRLARALERCEWAEGRHWNQVRSESSLAPTIRVDLIWPAERCIVEVDGPDHRTAEKYAADRVRDNALALEGFRILRFTNDQVTGDITWVLDVIKRMLTKLRHEEGKSS
jgi:very-short-patch-repair endonuclease